MNDVEYYRMKRLVPQLRKLVQEYPMHTLDNIIHQLEARLNHKKHSK